jgi:Pvc16 N-terminal domain
VATFPAIAATGLALVGLLKDASAGTEFADLRFELFQAADFASGTPMTEGVSLYAYRVAINATRRNMPPAVGRDGRRYRSPLPLDLYFLLLPWAKSAVRQLRILGWAMRQLHDVPILPASLLNHYGPEHDTFRPDEAAELMCETLTLQDMSNVLEPIKYAQPLAVAYVARMVVIESPTPIEEGEAVQTRVFDYAKVEAR